MNTAKTLILSLAMALASMTTAAQDTEMEYGPKATRFHLTTNDDARQVKLRIYNDGIGGKPVKTVSMKRDNNDARQWNAVLKGDLKGKFYTFDVNYRGQFAGECPGIQARAVGANGKRGAIVDLRDTDPEGWSADKRPDIPAKDLVIYEMHHRDFSIDPSSGIDNKGKYLALTEPRAIKHLKRLGVNAVHILPSFDYASVDETHLDRQQYNWGYDPVNYNVPEGGYATDPYRPETRINEFKRMVQALHREGIKVILDVVYNHTFDIGQSNFQHVRPDYFYRKNPDGTYSNGSGCGNETASERDDMRRFMVESAKYWVNEYHIDGFRFDLMGVHDIQTMNAIRQALPDDIFIYGEGWAAGSCALPYEQQAVKAHVGQMPGIAAFSDEMRDALRGPWDGDDKAAFLGGKNDNEQSIMFGIAGGIQHPQIDLKKVNYTDVFWAKQPTQLIAYVSCHDDMCLVDRLRASIPGISQEDLISLDLLAQTAVMTSQGVPFMLSGEEMLRDKKGVHNSYNSPDSINHLDWTHLERYPQVMDYYSRLIALRKNHPAFHLGDANLVRKHLEFLPQQPLVVAYKLKNHAGGDAWNDIYVALNANNHPVTIDVPQDDYTVVCRRLAICEQGIDRINGNQVEVPARSAIIFHN